MVSIKDRFSELKSRRERGEISEEEFQAAHKFLIYQISDETIRQNDSPRHKIDSDAIFGFLAIAMVFGLVIAAFAMCSRPSSPKNMCTGSVAKDSAYFTSQEFVKRQLKSPRSARFPNSNESGVSVIELDGCMFRISGYVNSDNSFGANIRVPYIMTVKADESGGTEYTLEDIALYE